MTRCFAGLRFNIDQHPTFTGCLKTTDYQTNPANSCKKWIEHLRGCQFSEEPRWVRSVIFYFSSPPASHGFAPSPRHAGQ
jgi:hypothetical protein